VNYFDGARRHHISDVREAMSIDDRVPIITCDARERQSTKQTLIRLVEHVLRQRAAAGV
jgi:signal recognition particle receptor subunit beta